jgi:oligogalacturonide transport system permease protein
MARPLTDRKKSIQGLLYISPWIIGFLIFQFYPFLMSLYYSFTNYSMLNKPRFVGLKNFIDMFTRDRNYWKSVYVTFVYVLVAVPMKLAFSLFIAMILNMKLKFINAFRTLYYIPSIFGGSVAVAILWRFLFNRGGIVNQFLAVFSIKPIDWLGSERWALFTISLLTVWQFGSSMVIFLAGLKQIPGEVVEAAKVDGAGRMRIFFKITLPFLSPMIFFNLILQTIHALQEFTAPFVITGGGPLKSTYLYGLMIYENAFKFLKTGYASAQSWILFLIIMVFTALVFKSSPYWTFYQDSEDNR